MGKERKDKIGGGSIVAEAVVVQDCPVHNVVDVHIKTSGGTPEERHEAHEALAKEIAEVNGWTRVTNNDMVPKEHRTREVSETKPKGRTQFGPPSTWKTAWEPSGSAWKKNQVN